MFVRARAPLRLGLSGGGTDIDAFSRIHGGCVINATIDLFSHCVVKPAKGTATAFCLDSGNRVILGTEEAFQLLPLQSIAVQIAQEHFCLGSDHFSIETSCEVPTQSGLGSSSAMLVAILKALAIFAGKNLEKEELAQMAHDAERVRLKMHGGRQDHWTASFGGLNCMEFTQSGAVKVRPLLLDAEKKLDLQSHLLLFYTGVSRCNSELIARQEHSLGIEGNKAIEAALRLKEDALQVLDYLQRGDWLGFARVLRSSWQAKKNLAEGVSNSRLDAVHETAIRAGAWAGKVSGAGGGGFMLFLAPPKAHASIERALGAFAGERYPLSFWGEGADAWMGEEDPRWIKSHTP